MDGNAQKTPVRSTDLKRIICHVPINAYTNSAELPRHGSCLQGQRAAHKRPEERKDSRGPGECAPIPQPHNWTHAGDVANAQYRKTKETIGETGSRRL